MTAGQPKKQRWLQMANNILRILDKILIKIPGGKGKPTAETGIWGIMGIIFSILLISALLSPPDPKIKDCYHSGFKASIPFRPSDIKPLPLFELNSSTSADKECINKIYPKFPKEARIFVYTTALYAMCCFIYWDIRPHH